MSRVRRLLAWVTAATVVATLTGCAIVRSSLDTTRALQSDGFGNVRVVPSAINGGTTVVVTGEAPPGSADPERLAAQDVWTHFAFRFVALDVRLAHRPAVSYSHDQLASSLGPRPPGFDRKTIGGSVGRIAAAVVAIGSGVVLAVVGLVAFLVVRHRRRHPRTATPGWPGYGPYGPPPPGYGPYGPPPPGYGPPAAPPPPPQSDLSSTAPPDPEGFHYRDEPPQYR